MIEQKDKELKYTLKDLTEIVSTFLYVLFEINDLNLLALNAYKNIFLTDPFFNKYHHRKGRLTKLIHVMSLSRGV